MEKEKVEAKSLKLGDNDIICSGCNSILTIPENIINDELIQCTKCEIAIINPFSKNNLFLTCGYCFNFLNHQRD